MRCGGCGLARVAFALYFAPNIRRNFTGSEPMSSRHGSSSPASPMQTAAAIAAGSFALIIGIVMIASFAVGAYQQRSLSADPAMMAEAVAKRLKPVGDLVITEVTAPKGVQSGEQVYTAVCAACHGAGIAGAPKFADKAGWAERNAQGYDALVEHAVKGIRGMPAKGGNPDLSDEEVARAVVHLANAAGASFKAPEAKAAPAAAPAAPAAGAGAAAAPAAVKVAEAKPAGDKGKSVYESVCFACHGAGIAGAPKGGDKAAWEPRLAQGAATLHDHAIKGIRTMPAKGGNPALADDDVKAAVDYMVAQLK